MAKKKNTEQYLNKRRETKRLSMQRARDKLKEDPEKLEEARRKDRERKKAKRKSINEMTNREQRTVRKQWKKCSKAYRDKQKTQKNLQRDLEVNTPPASPQDFNAIVTDRPSTSRIKSGSKTRRKNREKMRNEINELKMKNKELKKKVNKYKQRLHRINKPSGLNEITPRRKVKQMLKGQKCSNEIKKRLIFGEVLQAQITNNFSKEKSIKEKQRLAQFVNGKIVKKYRMSTGVIKLTSRRAQDFKNMVNTTTAHLLKKVKARQDVTTFLTQDENSKLCAGKKETKTVNKNKMQKRLLQKSLKNLHQKFILNHPHHKDMSYPQFCRYRPFWVVIPDSKNRDTCLCKIHTNMALIISKLKTVGMIQEKCINEVVENLTCKLSKEEREKKEACLERKCIECKEKTISVNEFDKDESVTYYQWVDKKEEITVRGKTKVCKKTAKVEITTTKEKLLSAFTKSHLKFFNHINNIRHQYDSIRKIKEDLKPNEVLLQMDFSENYNCKYTDEVQSFHFGGSRNQVTLHTSVLYYKNETNEIENKSFCSVSEERRHDNIAICGHLKPIFKEIKELVPNLTTIHFVSDGPTSQYRNRLMFCLLANYLAPLIGCNVMYWHYLEAGHGKGAPDGVGGCLKRTADNLVFKGTDIPNTKTLIEQLSLHCPGIKIMYVPAKDVVACDELSSKMNVPKFKGIFKTHQICWNITKKNIIEVRSLSCLKCQSEERCKHYGIGQMMLTVEHPEEPLDKSNSDELRLRKAPKRRFQYSDVYSDSEEENQINNHDEEENQINNHDRLPKPMPFDVSNVKIGHYVIARCHGKKTKKSSKCFIGLIQGILNDSASLNIKFLKKERNTSFFFFPENDDIADVEYSDILGSLSDPRMLIIKRKPFYSFEEDISQFKNLC